MQNAAGIRELKTHLSYYLQQVKAGASIVILERGRPIGKIVPTDGDASVRLRQLAQVGVIAWSGRKLDAQFPADLPCTRGDRTVSEMLLEDRE